MLSNSIWTSSVLFALAWWGLNQENTLIVAKNWNDATWARNKWDKPFLTIQAAINAASPNDSIYVRAGDYWWFDVNKSINIFWEGANLVLLQAKPTCNITWNWLNVNIILNNISRGGTWTLPVSWQVFTFSCNSSKLNITFNEYWDGWFRLWNIIWLNNSINFKFNKIYIVDSNATWEWVLKLTTLNNNSVINFTWPVMILDWNNHINISIGSWYITYNVLYLWSWYWISVWNATTPHTGKVKIINCHSHTYSTTSAARQIHINDGSVWLFLENIAVSYYQSWYNAIAAAIQNNHASPVNVYSYWTTIFWWAVNGTINVIWNPFIIDSWARSPFDYDYWF